MSLRSKTLRDYSEMILNSEKRHCNVPIFFLSFISPTSRGE